MAATRCAGLLAQRAPHTAAWCIGAGTGRHRQYAGTSARASCQPFASPTGRSQCAAYGNRCRLLQRPGSGPRHARLPRRPALESLDPDQQRRQRRLGQGSAAPEPAGCGTALPARHARYPAPAAGPGPQRRHAAGPGPLSARTGLDWRRDGQPPQPRPDRHPFRGSAHQRHAQGHIRPRRRPGRGTGADRLHHPAALGWRQQGQGSARCQGSGRRRDRRAGTLAERDPDAAPPAGAFARCRTQGQRQLCHRHPGGSGRSAAGPARHQRQRQGHAERNQRPGSAATGSGQPAADPELVAAVARHRRAARADCQRQHPPERQLARRLAEQRAQPASQRPARRPGHHPQHGRQTRRIGHLSA